MSTPEIKSTAKEWDEVRMGFQTSIMVDTSLSSLAQNLDAPDWPLQGKEETPAKYVDLGFEELRLLPGMNDHPERIDQLIAILRETLVFDDPFGDMVAQAAGEADRDNPLLKNLAKLGISADFPIEHTMVSADTKEFCALEKIVTLGEFAKFAQSMPPHVIVGGDFRSLLNALAHVNEEALASHSAVPPGHQGAAPRRSPRPAGGRPAGRPPAGPVQAVWRPDQTRGDRAGRRARKGRVEEAGSSTCGSARFRCLPFSQTNSASCRLCSRRADRSTGIWRSWRTR